MIICIIKNDVGPGNQMYMYSFAYSLAKEYHHKILVLSEISGYSVRQNILQLLKLDQSLILGFLSMDWINNPHIYRLIRLLINCILHIPIFKRIKQPAIESRQLLAVGELCKRQLYVTDGYWECHAYFDKFRMNLRAQYTPNYELPDAVSELVSEVEGCESVALHIRKGDFLQFGRLIDDSYYENAIQNARRRLTNPVFYLLTEDEGIKARYSRHSDFRVIDLNTPNKYIDEWYILKHCHHHIIANSTYSWWSSYLCDYENKSVIIPNVNEYLISEPTNDEEMYNNYYFNDDIIYRV